MLRRFQTLDTKLAAIKTKHSSCSNSFTLVTVITCTQIFYSHSEKKVNLSQPIVLLTVKTTTSLWTVNFLINLLHQLNKTAEAHVHFWRFDSLHGGHELSARPCHNPNNKAFFRVSTILYAITSQRETLALFSNHVSFNNLSNYAF